MRYSQTLFAWRLMVRLLAKDELWRRWRICGRLLVSNQTFVCSVWDNLWKTSVLIVVYVFL